MKIRQGDVAGALSIYRIRYYRDTARLAPASVDPLVAIALAERSRGRESAARKALGKALKLKPGNAEVRALLGSQPPRS